MSYHQEVEQLLRQAQAGDRPSLESLLTWLRARVHPWARFRLRLDPAPGADASDMAQEVCLRAQRAFGRLYEGCSPAQLLAWARKILDNVVADRRRRGRREAAPDDGFAGLA